MTWQADEILPGVKATPCGAFCFFGGPKDLARFFFFFFFFLTLARDQRGFLTFSFSAKFLVPSTFILSLHMEHNRRRNCHSQLPDSDPVDLCGNELTRIDLDSSAISVDTSKGISHHRAAPFPDELRRWTDWQHSLYLNSLEASFVNELYHGMHLRGWSVQNNLKEADKSRTSQKPCNMSGQFLILQDGCWKKTGHERNEPMLESTGDSHVLAGSPLRFTSVERGCAMRDFAVHHGGLLCEVGHKRGRSIFSSRLPRSSGKQHVCRSCYCELIASTTGTSELHLHDESWLCCCLVTEFTDQNFKDEDQGASSSSVPMDKRLKKAPADDASKNDQVVPIGKFYSTELSSSNNSSSENKGQDELLSELPNSFHLPKSDLHYFLRGS